MDRLIFFVFIASMVCCHAEDEYESSNLLELEELVLSEEEAQHLKKQKQDFSSDRTPDVLLHQFNTAENSPLNAHNLNIAAKQIELQKNLVSADLGISVEEVIQRISKIKATAEGRQTCAPSARTNRKFDGTCNNLENPEQGSAGEKLIRVVDNAYDDGFSKPRTLSTTGDDLPNARKVSRGVFGNFVRPREDDYTSLPMHFGQLADHDMTAVHAQHINCSNCSVGGECFSIPIEENDPVFGGRDCFHFPRSSFEVDSSKVRQHINSITSYLDASFVYGSDDKLAKKLQADHGFLAHSTDKVTKRDLLPPDIDHTSCASVNETMGVFCGLSGDARAAEQPGLTSLHTLFMREHNRVVRQLRSISTGLCNNKLYQTARKIVGAEWQHILYNEYLPLITGDEIYNNNDLSPNAPYEYDPEVDASVANVFAGAAFRFGHTQVPFGINRVDSDYQRSIPAINMHQAFFNASFLFDTSIPDGAVDSILRGMTEQTLRAVDRHFSDALTDNLFGKPDVRGDGFDLTTLNIQRGREHGLPSYTTIRQDLCELGEITSYEDLVDEDIMDKNDVQRLRLIYGKEGVKDIDPFVGFILEKHLPNTLVGPTLACIFADQFSRLKFGDRFFYQNPDQFTQAQVDEISKATMARLMCDNVEGVREIQPFVFIKPKRFESTDGEGMYDSFYEYSRSGNWPHQRGRVTDGLDNRRKKCAEGPIPHIDLAKFI